MARLAAGVRRRDNGTYEKRFTVDGKRYSVYGATTKEVQEKELELRDAIKKREWVQNCNLTLNQFFEEWQQQRKGTVKVKTILDEQSKYNSHIADGIGKRKIQKIEKREIIAVQQELSETLKPSSVNCIMTLLKSIFKAAVECDVIAKNPCNGVKALKTDGGEETRETIHRALSESEMTAFLSELNELYYPFFLFSFASGMRLMEISALTWGDVDKTKNVVQVTKTLSFRKGDDYAVSSPKSRSSKRDIPLTVPINHALALQKELMMKMFGGSALEPNEHIFGSIHRKPINTVTAKSAIMAALKELKKKGIEIEPFSHHCCRDTFATHYIRQGGNMKTLQKILGHSSLSMTMDIYTHVLEDTKQTEMDMISNVFMKAAGV